MKNKNKTVLGVLNWQSLEAVTLPFMRKRYGKEFDVDLFRSAASYITDLFAGRVAGYLPLDLPYHDLKHTLDTALAAARLVDGYENHLHSCGLPPLGPETALLTIICALFHDGGFVRRDSEYPIPGSKLMPVHVERSESMLEEWLQKTPLKVFDDAPGAIRYTDHVRPIADVEASVPEKWRAVGRIVGTADLMSQIADRFYLERCRDALFHEFSQAGTGVFESAEDLLRKTPGFVRHVKQQRLDNDFQSVYEHFELHFGISPCPYMVSINRNISYLEEVVNSPSPAMLKRDIAERLRKACEFDLFNTAAAI